MKIILSLIVAFLLACVNEHKKANSSSLQEENIVKQNSFFRLKYLNDSIYRIEWGTEKFSNVSKNTFEVLPNGVLDLLKKENNAILLTQSCGSSCKKTVLLPLQEGKTEQIYDRVLAFDLQKSLIAYVPDATENLAIRVEDFSLKTHKNYYIKNTCPAADPIECVENCHFQNGKLIVDYQGDNWNPKDNNSKTVTISIDL